MLSAAGKGLRVHGHPFWSRFAKGLLFWTIVNAVLYLSLTAQLTNFFSFNNFWWYISGGYGALVVAHAVLTIRDG